MKKLPLILSIIALCGVIALAIVTLPKGSKKPAPAPPQNGERPAIVALFQTLFQFQSTLPV